MRTLLAQEDLLGLSKSKIYAHPVVGRRKKYPEHMNVRQLSVGTQQELANQQTKTILICVDQLTAFKVVLIADLLSCVSIITAVARLPFLCTLAEGEKHYP